MTDYQTAIQLTAQRDPETLRACAEKLRDLEEFAQELAVDSADSAAYRIVCQIQLLAAEMEAEAADLEKMI